MKKALTIGGAVLGILLAAALVIFIFFPGIFTYLKVKHKFDHTDEKLSYFTVSEVPGSFESHTLKGVRFSTPSDWEPHSAIEGMEPGSYRADDDYSIMVTESDYKKDAELREENKDILSEYDPWVAYKYNEADYRHFYKSIGIELPQYGLPDRLLWYTRDGFTSKDCLKLRGKDKDVFMELAQTKEEAVEWEKLEKLKGSGFTAYAGQEIHGSYNGDLWSITIYPDSDENQYYWVMLKCPDETLAKQIISSLELE